MNDDNIRRTTLAGHEALEQVAPFLDMLDGMVASAVRRGFTEEQARAIVAYMFGYRPTDGSVPDGAGE